MFSHAVREQPKKESQELYNMSEKTSTKKSASCDWHPADIVAALRKAGWSIRKLSAHHGYSDPSTLSTALRRDWPKGEKLVAEAIGTTPERVWPERYEKRRLKAKGNTDSHKRKLRAA
jgi:Ner family transcriptional regulator